jgi:hypothetical protein
MDGAAAEELGNDAAMVELVDAGVVAERIDDAATVAVLVDAGVDAPEGEAPVSWGGDGSATVAADQRGVTRVGVSGIVGGPIGRGSATVWSGTETPVDEDLKGKVCSSK